MRHAILSDIHANWEALQTAAGYLQKQKIDDTCILGDTIDYGANPNECFDWMLKHARVTLLGNHEKAVVDPGILEGFSEDAQAAAIWTAGVLKPEYRKKIHDLSYLHINLFSTMVHGSIYEPEKFHYLFSFEDARTSFYTMDTPLGFIGHTHVPALFSESSESVRSLTPGVYELERNERYLINAGSVGQPRDRDPRLSLGIFDDKQWTFELIRLEYDNRKAAEKIRKAGLPDFLADRLL